jgi:flagella basal body P-ring formation protein FlgA
MKLCGFSFLFGFFMYLSAALADSGARPEIIFDSQIEISSSTAKLTLGDLVELKNPTVKMVESLENFTITSEQVATGLNAQSVRKIYHDLVSQFPSVAEENPKLVVPQKIEIKTSTGFSEKYFKRKLINHLSAQCSPCEVTIEKTTVPRIIMTEWKVSWEDLKLAASVLVPLEPAVEKANQTQWISVTLRIKKSAMVATRNMNFGERISEKDFETKWVNVSFAKEDPVTVETLKAYQLTARPIMKGHVVFPADLKQEPAAVRGQSVKALVGDESLEISFTAMAEETGRIGDQIKIKNNETKKTMTAVIVEKGVVRIL